MSPKRSDDFKADRRGEIVSAALRCFVAHGYERTTMRQIAVEAGVSTGAIYVYFSTKAAMLQAVCHESAATERAALLAALADLPADMDPIAAGLTAVLSPNLALSPDERRAHERLHLVMLHETARDPLLAASGRETLTAWRDLTMSLARNEQANGRIAADIDLDALADILMALPYGLEINELLSGRDLDWAAVIRTLSRVLWTGLAPPGLTFAAAPPAPGAQRAE